MAVLVKNPERIKAVVKHIVNHFQQKIEPNGFKAQVVVLTASAASFTKRQWMS